jgi:hypothetical protein
MERSEILEMMAALQLSGMRAAYDETVATGIKRKHGVEQIIGALLKAELAEKAARSFMTDPSLPEAMERGGVEGEPGIGLIERTEQKRYSEGSVAVTLVVHHRVHDYDVWKPVFDEHEGVRRSRGEIEHRIYQTLGDPASVVIHNDFPSEEAAWAFADDPSLPEAMERGGVDGKPGTGFINCTERKVYAASAVA